MYENVKFLPMSRREMDALGWDSIDILLLTPMWSTRHSEQP